MAVFVDGWAMRVRGFVGGWCRPNWSPVVDTRGIHDIPVSSNKRFCWEASIQVPRDAGYVRVDGLRGHHHVWHEASKVSSMSSDDRFGFVLVLPERKVTLNMLKGAKEATKL